jgi:hypothetical protein
MAGRFSPRHGRACPGHLRLLSLVAVKTWISGSRPGMTKTAEYAGAIPPHGFCERDRPRMCLPFASCRLKSRKGRFSPSPGAGVQAACRPHGYCLETSSRARSSAG